MKHHERPLVYIAAPYAHPDPVENTHRAIKAADKLHATGLVTCHVPHLTMLWHTVSPHPADHWYDYDLAILARCDALLRLPGGSTGADNEVRFATERGILTFDDEIELLKWARSFQTQ
jgi:hypothetical protein